MGLDNHWGFLPAAHNSDSLTQTRESDTHLFPIYFSSPRRQRLKPRGTKNYLVYIVNLESQLHLLLNCRTWELWRGSGGYVIYQLRCTGRRMWRRSYNPSGAEPGLVARAPDWVVLRCTSQDKLLRAEAVEDIIQLRQSRVSELGTGASGPWKSIISKALVCVALVFP